jgi:hypothetical protein
MPKNPISVKLQQVSTAAKGNANEFEVKIYMIMLVANGIHLSKEILVTVGY